MGTTSTSHTPTPWIKDGLQVTFDDMEVARCSGDDAQANAAFIVRAVNAHEELLDALKFVRQTVHQAYQHEGPIETCPKNTCDAATQAIAKAEGK